MIISHAIRHNVVQYYKKNPLSFIEDPLTVCCIPISHFKPLFPVKAFAFLMPLLLTRFLSLTMNFSTLCSLILNILEPLFFMRDSSSNITSLGALILVPKSSSAVSASSSCWSGKDQCCWEGKREFNQNQHNAPLKKLKWLWKIDRIDSTKQNNLFLKMGLILYIG